MIFFIEKKRLIIPFFVTFSCHVSVQCFVEMLYVLCEIMCGRLGFSLLHIMYGICTECILVIYCIYTAVKSFILSTYGCSSHAFLHIVSCQHYLLVVGIWQIYCADCYMSISYHMLHPSSKNYCCLDYLQTALALVFKSLYITWGPTLNHLIIWHYL